MTRPKPRKTRIHLTCPDKKKLQGVLERLGQQGYQQQERRARAQLHVFLGTAGDIAHLRMWLEKRADFQGSRLVFIYGPIQRMRRLLGDGAGFQLVQVHGNEARHFSERILGTLFLRDRPKPLAPGVIGQSKTLQKVVEQVLVCAQNKRPVLILGESGCGKEVCAQLVHKLRKVGKLFTVNCASLSPQLIDSQLFGHVKGAFTGADENRKGILEETGEGTCFLDEIGELQADAQANLLRLLEDSLIHPVGATRAIPFEGRLVLATNRDLETESQSKHFRFDLYQRLSTLTIELPPLRHRKEDIPLLIQYFLDELNEREGKAIAMPELNPCFYYDWPGNVRELKNLVTGCYIKEARPGERLPLDLQRQLKKQQQRQSQVQEEVSAQVPEAKAVTPRPQAPATPHVPFNPESDTWEDLSQRAYRTLLKYWLKREEGVTKTVIMRTGLSRTRIYRDLKNLGLNTLGEDV